MGKISESRGGVCLSCKARRLNEDRKCVECFTDFLFPILPKVCEYCSVPLISRNISRSPNVCIDCYHSDVHIDKLISITYEPQLDIGYALHAYKGSRMPQKSYMAYPLQCLVKHYLNYHYGCIQALYDIGFLTYVPERPKLLLDLVDEDEIDIIPTLEEVKPHDRYSTGGFRHFDDTRYKSINVEDSNILLFDDVFTSGATINSAAHALKEAGANMVIGLVVGRHISNTNITINTVRDFADENPFEIGLCEFCSWFKKST